MVSPTTTVQRLWAVVAACGGVVITALAAWPGTLFVVGVVRTFNEGFADRVETFLTILIVGATLAMLPICAGLVGLAREQTAAASISIWAVASGAVLGVVASVTVFLRVDPPGPSLGLLLIILTTAAGAYAGTYARPRKDRIEARLMIALAFVLLGIAAYAAVPR